MASASSFEDAKAYLQTKDGEGSVYDHLSEVVLKLIEERPGDALKQLEHISSVVKASTVKSDSASSGAGKSDDPDAVAARAAAVARLDEALAVLKVPGEDDEPGELGEGLQDLTDAANYLEWAGVSLGREEMFRLHLSLKSLSATTSARDLRFFGKLQGMDGDYIVAEGKIDAPDEEEEGDKDALGNVIERTGEAGANLCTYWVCPHVGGKWTQLPRVTPHQIIVSRQLRRYLRGDLEAEVGGHPPFPGNEAAYLRAVIARIAADTAVAPAGHFRRVEDDESRDIEVVPDDEYAAEDIASADGWVHTALQFGAKSGRTAPNPKEDEEEEGGDGEEEEEEPAEPLKAIAEDAGEGEENPPWQVRAVPSAGIPDPEPGLVVVKSTKWPGAVAVGFGRRFACAYVGYGIEAAKAPYQPALPAPVPAEFTVAAFNPAAEEAVFAEQPDVLEDPNAGKPAEGEEGEEEDDE